MGSKTSSLAIGIDVGATKIAAALITSHRQVLATHQVRTRSDQGIQSVLDQITKPANELIVFQMNDSKTNTIPLQGIGIGIPGQVSSKSGIVREAVNLGWEEVHLVKEIKARLIDDLPVWIETDANASTLGEFYFGAASGCPDFVYITIGSGLGAGAVANGSLVTGATGKAAELGNLSLNFNGAPCMCGLRGCAETIVSGPGLIRLVTESLLQKEATSRLRMENELTTATIVSAAFEGDALASDAISEMGRNLGIVLAFTASVLNPALIVIGGGLGLAIFDLLVPVVRSEIERRTLPSQLASSAMGAASLVLSQKPAAV